MEWVIAQDQLWLCNGLPSVYLVSDHAYPNRIMSPHKDMPLKIISLKITHLVGRRNRLFALTCGVG